MKKSTLLLTTLFFASIQLFGQIPFTTNTIYQGTQWFENPEAFRISDIDEDGDVDMVFSEMTSIVWLENDGLGNFTKHTISNEFAGTISIADLDGDGDNDIVSTSGGWSRILWLENDGAESFTDHIINLSVTNMSSSHCADLDQDGNMDILTLSGNGVIWHKNDGNQNFSEVYVGTGGYGLLRTTDIDDDGILDVIYATPHGIIYIYRGIDGQTFGYQIMHTGLNSILDIKVKDYDFDDDLDLLIGGQNGMSAIIIDELDWDEGYPLDFSIDNANNFYGFYAYGLDTAKLDNVNPIDYYIISGNYGVQIGHENEYGHYFWDQQLTPSNSLQPAYAVDIDRDGDLDVLSAHDNKTILWHEQLSSKAEFASYHIEGQVGESIIDKDNKTIEITMLSSVDVTNLVAEFDAFKAFMVRIPPGGIGHESGVTSNDYSSPLVLEVFSEDQTNSANWTITVNLVDPETDILSYYVLGQSKNASIDTTNHTIEVFLNAGLGSLDLPAFFNLSTGATAKVGSQPQENLSPINDYSAPITYTITAIDGVTVQDWLINPMTHDASTWIKAESAIYTYDNVAIGSNSSSYQLDVNGTINASEILVDGEPIFGEGSSPWIANGDNLDFLNGSISTINGSSFEWKQAYDERLSVIGLDGLSYSAGTLSVEPGSGSYFSGDVSNISFLGNMAIGTSIVPSGYALAVSGDIQAKRVKVTTDEINWPDYVFSSRYKPMSLEKLDSYIKENKHLPGIPSAQEVKEEGIDLGSMDAKLLEKIEELTLYMIELKKENELLKEEFKRQNNEFQELKLSLKN